MHTKIIDVVKTITCGLMEGSVTKTTLNTSHVRATPLLRNSIAITGPRADLLSERNLYLASIGLVLAIIVLCSRLMQWLKA